MTRCGISVSPSYFYYGAAPCPFSPAPCPISQRHALFLNLHIMPYILVKKSSKSDINQGSYRFFSLKPVVTNKAAVVVIKSHIG